MAAETFPADRTPIKPIPEIGEIRAADIRSRSFGRKVLYGEAVWVPSELDRQYFNELAEASETKREVA